MSTRPKDKLTIYLLKSYLMKREIIIPLTLFLITIPKELYRAHYLIDIMIKCYCLLYYLSWMVG